MSAPITARPLQKSFLHPCLALCWVLIKFIATIIRVRVRVSVRILGLRKPKVKVKAKFRWYIQFWPSVIRITWLSGSTVNSAG